MTETGRSWTCKRCGHHTLSHWPTGRRECWGIVNGSCGCDGFDDGMSRDIVIPAAEGTDVLLDTTPEAFQASVDDALTQTLAACRATTKRLSGDAREQTP